MLKTELLVVGAGPAGLAAAIEAKKGGVKDMLLVDLNMRPGGQLFKQIHKFFGSRAHQAGTRGYVIGQRLLEQVEQVDPLKSDSDLTLPGWDASYSREELRDVVAQYQVLTEEDLWANLKYFLEGIIPTAAECGVNMAIHQDDPCWSIFGLPRIITCEENLDRFLKLVDDPHNGLTLCCGSLGCSPKNDVVKLAAKYAKMGRIHFVHLRNVQILPNGFEERAHLSQCGSLDMYGIVKALVENGFDGYVRPDHGRMIWGETGRAGYGLYDRALGAAYINGLFEAAEKEYAAHG